ncbi:hypothetical protein ACFPQB_03875 [Nocardioides vastitatis]|uniref:Uncharacterized protein n=1 Tax=Nocardioides vastitatis TaxID=2568655 RepID=A0ABW0ZER1_9ACTN
MSTSRPGMPGLCTPPRGCGACRWCMRRVWRRAPANWWTPSAVTLVSDGEVRVENNSATGFTATR